MPNYVDESRFPGPDPYAPLKDVPTFALTSTDFSEGEQLPEDQRGKASISPQLAWKAADLPEGTKSLAVTCLDPDAPTGAGFWHWGVFNIPADTTEIARGAGKEELQGFPGSVTLKNTGGGFGYYGSQPPAGHAPHRYLFVVHALDVGSLDIPKDASISILGFNLYHHTLARGFIWGWDQN